MKIEDLIMKIEDSYDDNPINEYALMLLEDTEISHIESANELLNGASDWFEFSYGGSSLVYDDDIENILRHKRGEESWLDAQAVVLEQAADFIDEIIASE